MNALVLRRRVDAAAQDLGRLLRRLDAGSYDLFLAQRVAEHISVIDALAGPSAATICRANTMYGAGEDEAADLALGDVDARAAELRRLLGEAR